MRTGGAAGALPDPGQRSSDQASDAPRRAEVWAAIWHAPKNDHDGRSHVGSNDDPHMADNPGNRTLYF